MKNKALLTALLASAFGVAIPTSAEAALIFGFNQFGATAGNESAATGTNYQLTGFTVTALKTQSSSDANGSSDGFYGSNLDANGVLGGGSPVTLPTANGNLRLTGSNTIISILNGTSSSYQLDRLFFDAWTVGTQFYDIEVSSQYGAGSITPLYTGTDVGFSLTAGADYTDYTKNMSAFIVNPGETFNLLFKPSSNISTMRLDNIALTGSIYTPPSGVPEPANFAALGGLLISGLAIRSRRRPAKA